jgi:hypothetical protein
MKLSTRKVIVVLVVIVVGLAAFAGKVLATSSTGGYQGTTLATATFDALHLSAHGTPPNPWDLLLLTHQQSDLYVQQNHWPAGSSTGWHTHPGPSLIILKQPGILTEYEWEDGTCTEHVYDATNGNVAFLDTGGPGHAHILINNGPGDATTYAVQFVPHGATRRIDVTPAPPNCGLSS